MKILTKSNYITSIQCAKKAYFDKNNPIKSELNRHIVEGFQVEEYAETLFSNAIKAPNSQTEGLLKTQELICESIDSILQPSVQSNGMYAKADAISKNSDGWSLYEFKSGTKVDKYIQDITFQFNVFKSAGINITQTFLILVNKDYIKDDSVVPSEYLNIVDVTQNVLNQSEQQLSSAYNALRVINQFNEPEVLIHKQCNFNKPGEACPYISRCYTQINDDNVLFIPRLSKKKLVRLHELNIHTLDGINLENPQIELTEIQAKYVESFQCKEPIIDFFKLDNLIQEIENNNIISFLDFETYQSAIPFKNSKPFQQHPFQFSSISIGENFYSNNDYINTQFERNDERLLI